MQIVVNINTVCYVNNCQRVAKIKVCFLELSESVHICLNEPMNMEDGL